MNPIGPFIQKSSYIRRLRATLTIIAIFFLIGIMSLFLSSHGFLRGLQDINTVNETLNLSTISIEGLSSADALLEKPGDKEISATFSQTVAIIENQINQALIKSKDLKEVQNSLHVALKSLHEYQNEAHAAFQTGNKENLVVAKEFSADTREALRRAQVKLNQESDYIFTSLFESRFRPLIVVTFLSILFFAFVVTVGLASTRQLSSAMSNLKSATDNVGKGNLEFVAPILRPDEFGTLTNDFNMMVKSLKSQRALTHLTLSRISTLQTITEAFSSSLISDDIVQIILNTVLPAFNADAGTMAFYLEDQSMFEVRRYVGYTDQPEKVQRISINTTYPAAVAIRKKEPLFAEGMDAIKENFSDVTPYYEKAGLKSLAAIPLMAGGEVLGVVIMSFRSEKVFDESERAFMIAAARQCSQALHRTKLYEKAKEAVQVRDEFLSIASHELRTPLTPLKLKLQTLARQIKKGNIHGGEQYLPVIDSLERQVKRLTDLIDDLLDVSRISAGKLTLKKEAFNIYEAMEEVISQYNTQLKNSHPVINFTGDTSLMGDFDKVRFEQVFINLLTNAAKYAPGKPVHISLDRRDDFAEIKVRDEGPGISEENQKRIFDRFERVKDRDNIGGLGLGLYISRQIVEAHGGKIYVESSSGEGSTFIVLMPLEIQA